MSFAVGDLGHTAEHNRLLTLVDAARIDTSQTTASATYVDLATVGPVVTEVTGTSVLVIVNFRFTVASTTPSFVSVAVSGATTRAAADADACPAVCQVSSAGPVPCSAMILLTGLTAGTNTFTMRYRAGAGTPAFSFRSLAVLRLN